MDVRAMIFGGDGDSDSEACFKVVAPDPARAKRAMKGDLKSTDIAISIHQEVGTRGGASGAISSYRFVNNTPTSFRQELTSALLPQDVPLLLSTSLFSLPDLCSCVVWKVDKQLVVLFDGDEAYPNHADLVSIMLQQLASSVSDGSLLISPKTLQRIASRW